MGTRRSWLVTAILIGLLYSAIGIAFALPSNQGRMWRLAAWIASAAAFVFHFAYEHFRLGHSPRVTALHATLAVAVGAFGLAVAANIHEVLVSPNYRRSLAVALFAWPALAALPAFFAALITAHALTLARPRLR
jgi:hypothetical protein